MNPLLAIAVLASAVPAGQSRHGQSMPAVSTETLAAMDYAAVTGRMAESALHRIEGVWMFPGDGGMIAIERLPRNDGATEYVMAVVKASNRLLLPGTVIGRLWPTAVRNSYEARIYTSMSTDGETLLKPQTFTVNLTDSDSRIQLLHHRKQLKLNWWVLLPYMFHRFVRQIDETPRHLEGCVRVYPTPAMPAEPRYL